MFAWLCCFWACDEVEHHDGEHVQEREQKEERRGGKGKGGEKQQRRGGR
jgi:hypothetical protein